MTPDRMEELMRWRDYTLWTRYRDQDAAVRLAPDRKLDAALAAAADIRAPDAEEIQWTDHKGEPLARWMWRTPE